MSRWRVRHAMREPPGFPIRWCCCHRPAPRSTSTAISKSAARNSATSSRRCPASSRWCEIYLSPAAVSRTRCSVLHAAPQSRDPRTMGPGSAAHRKSAALHPGHEAATVQNISNSLTCWKPSWATNGADLCLLGTAMISREQRTPFSDWWWTFDRPLLAAIIALMLGGLVLSLAASPPVATRIGLDPFHFFNRHVLFLLPAFIALIGVSFLSPRQIRRTALILLALSIALIVATLLFGPEVKGSRRWITLIGVNIQASESAKPAFVVMAAWLFAESARRPEMPATSIALVLLMMLVSLLVLEPDFGQTMLILMVWGALFFIAGMRMIWVLGL